MPKNLDYELLQELAEQPDASQRNLANRLGVSVGKVNYCLRALVDKGWIKARNFKRSDNKWAYTYLLTPSGAAAKLRLTRAFLAHKEQEFLALQAEIAALRSQLSTVESARQRQAVMIRSEAQEAACPLQLKRP